MRLDFRCCFKKILDGNLPDKKKFVILQAICKRNSNEKRIANEAVSIDRYAHHRIEKSEVAILWNL